VADEKDVSQMTEQEYLAHKYGDFQVNEFAQYERDIEDEHGNTRQIYIRKFSEKNVQEREEVMIDQSGVERSAKNQRRQANRGTPPPIKIKPSHRRRFDIIRGVRDWNLTRIKRNKDGDIVWEKDAEGNAKKDENGFRIPVIEDIECSTKEKMQLAAFVSEQMIRHVRKLNDLPLEDQDEDDEPEEKPAKDEPRGDFDTDYDHIEGFGDEDEEGDEGEGDNVVPLGSS
jgi:hypothetical protein